MSREARYHSFVDYDDYNYPCGFIVPQRVYVASGPFPRRPTIYFQQDGHPGVYLCDALRQRVGGMPDREDRPETTSTSSKITIRINWTGYADFQHQMNAKEHSQAAAPIPKWKIAMCVAQAVHEFYAHCTPAGRDIDRQDWDVCTKPFDKLRLLELHHVSSGSWQPVLVFDAL